MKRIIRNIIILVLLGAANNLYAGEITFGWDANTEKDLAGYNLYIGTQTSNYTQSIDVGNVTQFTLKNVPEAVKRFYSLTARDNSGNVSDFADELTYTIPDTTKPVKPLRFKISVNITLTPVE